MSNKFRYTTTIRKIRALKRRKKVIQGGSSAAKTFAILSILTDKAIKTPNLEISVVSQSVPHLKRGAYKDFIKILKMTGRYRKEQLTETRMKYTFKNGSYIEFFSVEDEDKVLGARRNILYINEANRIKFDTYHQLAIRTDQDIFIDFNPTKRFWVHNEVIGESDVDFITVTYMDNEARPANVDNDMAEAKAKHDLGESPYWINYWRVYGLGLIGALEGCIWTDWSLLHQLPVDEETGEPEYEFLGIGIDFGYKNPAAAIGVYKWNGRYIFDEWVYDVKLSNKDLAQQILANGYGGEICYCDSAEPKSIDALLSEGINAEPCGSKQDIREFGIKKISSDHFYVTESSKSLINDLENYVWMKTKTGEELNRPLKQNDHGPDAMIYFVGTEEKFSGQY
jgi:phage terminase large subunit